jgi:hypothetical protein
MTAFMGATAQRDRLMARVVSYVAKLRIQEDDGKQTSAKRETVQS